MNKINNINQENNKWSVTFNLERGFKEKTAPFFSAAV